MDHAADQPNVQQSLRNLPSVDSLLKHPSISNLLDEFPRSELLRAVRATLDETRARIQSGDAARNGDIDPRDMAMDIRQKLYDRRRANLRRVINATGIVLHTGLGRSPLAAEAVEAIADVAAGYCNLELDLESGQRGDRQDHLRELLRELTGAQDALVVNNCAAATYLTLNTLAAGRGVIVSRGELVEIGGSYRMPDIMAAAGCRMMEVGTTNRTRIADYERAIRGDDRFTDGYGRPLDVSPAVLLRVHCSNYRVQGFTESASLPELVALARRFVAHKLLVVDDLGGGLLDTPAGDAVRPASDEATEPRNHDDAANSESESSDEVVEFDLERQSRHSELQTSNSKLSWDEPTVRSSVSADAHLTLFSGDKLLGGPQAGIIVGRADLIARLYENPLMRTFRPDKLTLVALEATLRLYRDPHSAYRRIPVFAMLLKNPQELEAAARDLEARIKAQLGNADVSKAAAVCSAADESFAGGGSLPTLPFPTYVVRVQFQNISSAAAAAQLRSRDLPIICRIQDNWLVFDTRTLNPDDAEQIALALADAARELAA